MTTNVAINMGSYALLGSDARAKVYDPKGNVSYEDGEPKLFRTSLGLGVGTGLEELLNVVADALEEESIREIWDLEKALVAAKASARHLRMFSPIVAHAFDVTKFFFTAAVCGETRVLLYAPDHREDGFAGFCKAGDVVLYAPAGSADGQDAEWQRQLRKRLRPLKAFSTTRKSIDYHTALLKDFVRELAMEYPAAVSPSGMIGCHRKNGTITVEEFGLLDLASSVTIAEWRI